MLQWIPVEHQHYYTILLATFKALHGQSAASTLIHNPAYNLQGPTWPGSSINTTTQSCLLLSRPYMARLHTILKNCLYQLRNIHCSPQIVRPNNRMLLSLLLIVMWFVMAKELFNYAAPTLGNDVSENICKNQTGHNSKARAKNANLG